MMTVSTPAVRPGREALLHAAGRRHRLPGEAPDYHDFAYLALTIGMTFQVSDTDLTGKDVRCVALHRALLSSVFGTGIVAITVSSVAALLGR
jgi:uncharacterized membrane protein